MGGLLCVRWETVPEVSLCEPQLGLLPLYPPFQHLSACFLWSVDSSVEQGLGLWWDLFFVEVVQSQSTWGQLSTPAFGDCNPCPHVALGTAVPATPSLEHGYMWQTPACPGLLCPMLSPGTALPRYPQECPLQ